MTCFFRSAFIGITAFALILAGIAKRAKSEISDITIGWKDNILSIYLLKFPEARLIHGTLRHIAGQDQRTGHGMRPQ